jgi:hypothetical protein
MFKKASEMLEDDTEFHSAQEVPNQASLCIILPRRFCDKLGIKKKDMMCVELMANNHSMIFSKCDV